ncbi:MAG: HIT family protein [Candidatus Bathyarchaeota archaeon]|nr:MAG: HIT family protein [Candidatus Bathyarchaeota archaeon]
MQKECPFCNLVNHTSPASYVYEDDAVLAFMDIRPISKGHVLVIPKTHYQNIYEIPSNEVSYLFKIVKKIALAMKKALSVDGLSIAQNNGAIAGQVIFHLHIHLIPRYNHIARRKERWTMTQDQLDTLAAKIQRFL